VKGLAAQLGEPLDLGGINLWVRLGGVELPFQQDADFVRETAALDIGALADPLTQ